MILLNPGPVTLSPRVRNALLGEDLCHREIEFGALQSTIRSRLLEIYDLDPAQWAAVLLTGSGTAAVEAMLTSLVPSNGKVVIADNGVYGERMQKIAHVYGIEHSSVSHAWGAELDLDAIGFELDKAADAQSQGGAKVSHLAVVHHETTTGRLNQLEQLAALCKERAVTLMLDGVSSFGAEEIRFDEWNLAACAATANKCLHGVPGTSFAIVKRSALENKQLPERSVYLNLPNYCRNQDRNGTPFTQSVQTFYALAEALAEMQEAGGWRARREDYLRLAEIVRSGLKKLGIESLLPTQETSVVLTAYHLPVGIAYSRLHDHLKQNGFVIYAGQGDLSKTLFRVSTMGSITDADMRRFVDAVGTLVAA